MNNFYTLLKLFLQRFFSQFRIGSKKSFTNKRVVMSIVIFTLIALSTFGSLFSLTYEMAKNLSPLGLSNFVLIFAFIVNSILWFTITIFSFHSIFGENKENSLLFSLPIKTKDIFLAKITTLAIINLFISSLILLPAFISFSIFEGINILGALAFLTAMILMPVIPFTTALLLSLILGFLVKYIRVSRSLKVFFQIIILIIYLMFTMVLMFTMNPATLLYYSQSGVLSTLTFLTIMIDKILIMINGTFTSYYFLFIAINSIIFALVAIIISSFYKKLLLSNSADNKNNKIIENYQPKKIFFTLIQKEYKKYFSSPVYVLNTLISVILLLIFSIISIFSKSTFKNLVSINLNINIFEIILVIMIFCSAITCTTAVSISLEGKKIDLIKSLPIKPIYFYFSKILFNILIAFPFILISGLIFTINFNIIWYNGIILIILPIFLLIFTSIYGLFINLKFPSFNYTNETEIIKQSISSLLGMLPIPFLSVILFLIYFLFLNNLFNLYLYILLFLLLILVLSVVLIYLLIKNSKKYFNNL